MNSQHARIAALPAEIGVEIFEYRASDTDQIIRRA